MRFVLRLVLFLFALTMLLFPKFWEPMHRDATIIFGFTALFIFLYSLRILSPRTKPRQ